MEMMLALMGVGGDARLTFTTEHIRLRWGDTTSRERKMIAKLVKRARKLEFQVVTVDADGKPDRPAYWKDLPGMFGKGQGEIMFQGPTKAIQEIATELVDDEIKGGCLVFEAQSDGTWKIVKELGQVKPKEGEKRELKSTRAMGGG